ncbi:MAG: DUF2062 domain-containing protein [Desulfobacterales bacterium]|nr:DUF2062 domain-containing protein [Desulfobacterales bacterium]
MKNSKFIVSIKKTYKRFLKIRGNPHEIALGFALGLFVGMTPFMGLQTLIAVPIAALFKLNKIAAAAAVWISNPLTAPVIYPITYWIGSRFVTFKKAYELPNELTYTFLVNIIKKAPEVVWSLVVGGVIVGIPLALIGYYFSFNAIVKYRERIKEKLVEKKEKLKTRLKKRSHKSRGEKQEEN